MKLHDELCKDCPNKTIKHNNDKIPCPGKCLLIKWIGGNEPIKERLLDDIKNKPLEPKDYNTELSELIENQRSKINHVFNIDNIRQRAITVLLLAGITQNDISSLLSMSYRQINRIVNNNK